MSKRDSIGAAALSLFAERGVAATSTRAIAERAGTAEGNIYRHFLNKDELARTLFDQSAAQFHACLQESLDTSAAPGEQIAGLVSGVFLFAERNRAAFDYLLSVHHTPVVTSRESSDQPLPLQLFVATIRAGMASGAFREVDPVLATGWIVSMTQRAAVLGGSALVDVPLAQVKQDTAAAALRTLAV